MAAEQSSKQQAFTFSALLCVCIFAPVALVSLWPSPPGITLAWDWANGMGYLALGVGLLLFVYRGRARRFPPYSGRFFANLHRDLGYIALLLLAGHVIVLLLLEPLLLEHLKPTAPLHMLAGLLALILMSILVVSSIPVLRRRLWPDYHLFRHLHAVLAVSILVLTAFHVWGAGFYLNSHWKQTLLLAVALAVLGFYALVNYRSISKPVFRSRSGARFSHLVTYGCTAFVLLLCLVLAFGNNLE